MAAESLRPIGVTARDRRTLEVRRLLPLPKSDLGTRFGADLYLFFPRSFGISRETFRPEDFYRDGHVYLRLTAPTLRLSELCDLEHAANPAGLLRRQLPALLEADPPPREAMASLPQMFGAELCDAFTREALALLSRIAAIDDEPGGPTLAVALERYCADALHALGGLRRVRAKAFAYRAVAHPSLFDSLAFAEEYACSVLDEQLATLGQAIDASPGLRDGTGLATKLRLKVAEAAAQVNRRRLEQGFAVPWGGSPEYFCYRIGLLKKELQRSLYVDARQRSSDPFFRNSAAIIAAGLAATWATLAQLPLWTGSLGTRQGLLFLGGAVGAYVLKDRIKEWTRDTLTQRLRRWDHERRLVGDALSRVGLGSFVGRAFERVRYLAEDEVPGAVRRLRLAHRTVAGVTPEREVVLRYERRVELVQSKGNRVPDGFCLQELFRLSLDEVLRRLDDPLDRVAFFDHTSGRVCSRELPKVYHLNLVVVVTGDSPGGAQSLSRHRVVVDRGGILRIDDVEGPRSGARAASRA